jgi:hypothetical protein
MNLPLSSVTSLINFKEYIGFTLNNNQLAGTSPQADADQRKTTCAAPRILEAKKARI